ncbi:hypothetical protein [Sphingomonas sp.]|nr:hypothetical protein [Sphingomonas sp.]MBO9712525.1 hypothetical protein [Sphingomonas sp.]
MKLPGEPPLTVIERDDASSLPPGGGLAIVVAGSMLFWGVLLWFVLHR